MTFCAMPLIIMAKWNSKFFAFSLTIEGTTEKVLQFPMPLKSIYNKNLGFIEQKCIFEHNGEVQTIKNLLINIFWCNFFSDDLFRAAPIVLG
jgi:hypothetical protein